MARTQSRTKDVSQYAASVETDVLSVINILIQENIYDPIFVCYAITDNFKQVEVCFFIADLNRAKTISVPLALEDFWDIWEGEGKEARYSIEKFRVLDSFVYNTTDGFFLNDESRLELKDGINRLKIRILKPGDLYND